MLPTHDYKQISLWANYLLLDNFNLENVYEFSNYFRFTVSYPVIHSKHLPEQTFVSLPYELFIFTFT